MLVVDASALPMMPNGSQLLHVPKKAGNTGAPFGYYGYDCRLPIDWNKHIRPINNMAARLSQRVEDAHRIPCQA